MRVGVFRNVGDADVAVHALVAAGIRKEHVSVLCSDPVTEWHFREYDRAEPAGSGAVASALLGACVGGIAGGLAGLVGAAAAGPSFLAAEPMCIGTGILFGTFIGAMVSRSHEHEVSNYYDQAMRRGQILVAAQVDAGEDAALLERAEDALSESGAHPLALPRG